MKDDSDDAVRLAELIAALSLATDLGMGQPLEHALRTCLLATQLGVEAGLDEPELAEVYYVALLRYVGCTADAHEAAALFGDEIAARAAYALIDPGQPLEMLGFLWRQVGLGAPRRRKARLWTSALAAGRERARAGYAAHCEVAQMLARRLAVRPAVERALGFVFERWDGKGFPRGISGEAIPLSVRLAQLSRDAEIVSRLGGAEAATAVVRDRTGSAYDPSLGDLFCRRGPHLLAGLEVGSSWEAVLAAEPGERLWLSKAGLDEACRAVGEVADLKSPFFVGHSAAVGELAEAAAWRMRLPSSEVAAIRRAGYLQDLGRVGVSNAVWDKPGPLAEEEWERVRLHPYFTERALARSPGLAPIGALAAMHHERLDGSGYPRGAGAPQLGVGARILAVSDVYQALVEERPHRPARVPAAAIEELQREAREAKLGEEVVGAVLGALGHRVPPVRREWPAGLSDREVEVLRLLAHGLSNREMAERLVISPKTVGHHVEHIYRKVGVTTRAAATLFALEHNLLRD